MRRARGAMLHPLGRLITHNWFQSTLHRTGQEPGECQRRRELESRKYVSCEADTQSYKIR